MTIFQRGASSAATAFKPIRRSSMNARQRSAGAVFVDVANWQVADVFRSRDAELAAARQGVGIVDLSHLGKIRLEGSGIAERLGSHVGAALPAVGRVTRLGADKLAGSSASPADPDAGLLLGQLADEFIILTEADQVEAAEAALVTGLGGDSCVHVADITSQYLAVGLVGPKAAELLRLTSSLDVRSWILPNESCVQGSFAKVQSTVVRSDLGGQLAFRILTTRAYGQYVWDLLLEAGHGLGVAPIGRQAWLAL